jgi:HK97 family phage major capsid protein
MPEPKDQVKEITMEELKGLISEQFKELMVSIKDEVTNELKASLPEAKQEKTKEEKAEEVKTFINNLVEGKTTELKAVSSVTGSFGYTIPTELASSILEKRDKISKMRKVAFQFSMSGPFQLPKEGTGVTSYWVGENTEITESNPTTTKTDLTDYYLATRVLMPRQLLNTSAYNLVEYISNLSSRSIVKAEETAFVNGSGSGQPTGLRATAGENVLAQAGAGLSYADVINLYYHLPEQYRANAIFMTSTNGMKALDKIVATDGKPILDVMKGTLLGKPIFENVDIPQNLGTSANETELWLFDPFYYWIKDGESMFMDTNKIISKMQLELVVGEAIDGIFTLAEAAACLESVK